MGIKKEHKIKKSDRIRLQTKHKGFLTYARFTVYQFFLGLQEKDHIIREEVGKIFHIVVSSDTTEQFCHKCGCATKYIKGYYNQTVKAGYLSGIPIEVVLRKRRYAR